MWNLFAKKIKGILLRIPSCKIKFQSTSRKFSA